MSDQLTGQPVNPSTTYDLIIVGCGAAGLMAGIWAGRTARAAGRSLAIAALDSATSPGAKILVSGGGRCNVTHDMVTMKDFAGSALRPVGHILQTFTVADTITFFAELGVQLKREETGKLFPVTDKARTVLDALLHAAAQAGVRLLPGHRVTGITGTPTGFALNAIVGHLKPEICPLKAPRLILATGGQSLPKTGSDGSGYALARSLGHTITPPFPALVPLVLPQDHWLTTLSGISIDALLSVQTGRGKVLHRQAGSLLLTHFGLSGPAVLDLSRHWIAAHTTDPAATVTANLLPGQTFDQLDGHFVSQAANRPRMAVAEALRSRVHLPARLADALCQQQAGIDPRTALGQVPREARRRLAHALTALPLPVVGDRGFLFAEVTAGGVPLSEIDPATLASRKAAGLYLCGEILDVDGRVGGYNFQWAWCTGRLAGQSAVGGG